MATQYPANIDTTITLPTAVDNLTPITATSVNILRDAILAIESTLGPGPAALYGTVGNRLTVLENAINNGGGGGGGNFVAGGDLSGTSVYQTVIGLQGHPVATTQPTTGYVLTWSGSAWAPAAATGGSFTPGGDLGGTSTAQIVEGLYSHPLASTAPSQSYVPVWDTALGHYSIRQLTTDDLGTGFTINSFAGGSTVDIGVTITNPAFTASYSATPSSANITNTDGTDSPLTLTSPYTSGTVVGTFHHTSQSTVTFTLTATGTSTKTAQQSINYYPRMFAGVGSPNATSTVTASGTTGSPTATLSTGDILSNEGLTSNPVGSTYGPFSPSGQKIYLLLTGSGHVLKDPNTNTQIPTTNTGTAVSFDNLYSATVTMYLYETLNTLTGSFSVSVSS